MSKTNTDPVRKDGGSAGVKSKINTDDNSMILLNSYKKADRAVKVEVAKLLGFIVK